MLEDVFSRDNMVFISDWKQFKAQKINKRRNLLPSAVLAFQQQFEISE